MDEVNAGRMERNRYAREWRAKNKEKVKAINARYWARRARRNHTEQLEQNAEKRDGNEKQ